MHWLESAGIAWQLVAEKGSRCEPEMLGLTPLGIISSPLCLYISVVQTMSACY